MIPYRPGAPVLCRPVRPSDREQAFAFLRWIWEGDDYLPLVWDDWLSDPKGLFVAAEHRGLVVGLGRLVELGDGEAWLEGLRVDPDYQGRGVASHIHDFLLGRWSVSWSAVVRLATSSTHEAVHRICARTGFRQVATLIEYTVESEAGRHPFVPLSPSSCERALDYWTGSTLCQAMSGLMELRWEWVEVTLKRLASHAAAGAAWGWRDGEGMMVADRHVREDPESLRIQAIAVRDDSLADLLEDVRRLAADLALKTVRWKAPAGERWERTLRHAGYRTDWTTTLFVFERRQ